MIQTEAHATGCLYRVSPAMPYSSRGVRGGGRVGGKRGGIDDGPKVLACVPTHVTEFVPVGGGKEAQMKRKRLYSIMCR